MNWRDIFIRDWHLKIIALAFSITLWSFVVGQEKAEIGLSIPIEIINLPSNLVISNDLPSDIQIRVFGPRSIIRNIASQNLTKVIDLKDASPGKMLIHLAADDFSLPGGVKVLRIKPSIIEIVLQPLLRKTVPVRPVLINKPAQGYEVERVMVQPLATQISGPAKVVASIKELKLLPVDLTGARKTFTAISSPDIGNLRISVEGAYKFRVTVYIRPKKGVRQIKHVPVRIYQGQYKVSVWPTEVTVKLCGEIPALKKLRIEDISVSVNATSLQPGRYTVEPRAQGPPGFECLEIIPKKVQVRISREKIR